MSHSRRPLRPVLQVIGVGNVFPTNPDRPENNRLSLRCVIADDHTLLRQGVRRLLEESPEFSVVGEAGDAAEALKLVLQFRPDLLLLDISMPGMSSFEAARLIAEHCPATRVVYLTMHEDEEYLLQAMRSGACGYLLKDTPANQLRQSLRDIHNGSRTLSPRLQNKLRTDAQARRSTDRTLTPREREVMKLLAEGNSVREAAVVLGVSIKTVEAHKLNLMRKLDIHNKAQLVTAAIRKKIVVPPVPM